MLKYKLFTDWPVALFFVSFFLFTSSRQIQSLSHNVCPFVSRCLATRIANLVKGLLPPPPLCVSVCFCPFLSASSSLCLSLFIYVCFCRFMSAYVRFCLFLSVSGHFCSLLSVFIHSVCFCPFL